MTDYNPPYTITNKMLKLVSSISEKAGMADAYGDLDSRPHLRRNNRIRSIHSSLKIEANSLTFGQVKDVINGKTVIGSAQEIMEVRNADNAYGRIKDVDPYSIRDLKMMHGIMEKNIIADAGRFRNGEEGVFRGDQCIFIAPPPNMVPSLMNDLFKWMKKNRNDIHPLIMSAVFHYEFVFIHPFSDGNGRLARLWHTVLLTAWEPVFEYIPLENQIEKFQDGYYQAISDCHVAGNSDLFIEFMLERINEIITETVDQIKHPDEMLSKYVKQMLSVMDFNVPYTLVEIMNKLSLSSKDNFHKNYMDPALESGLVKMTIPDKPNSRNQRYIRK